jgi:hypothetical protein
MMDKTIRQMTKIRGIVDVEVRKVIDEIIALCWQYKHLGKRFSFTAVAGLDARINALLVKLSDLLYERFDNLTLELVEEQDRDDALAYIHRTINGKSHLERIDAHSTHLKHYLEGFIAVAFVANIDIQAALLDAKTYLSNPMLYKHWRDAVGKGFTAGILQTGEYGYGRGVLKNPIDGLTMLGQMTVNSGYQFGVVRGYRRMAAIGYGVQRNSNYDCPLCDSLTKVVHPLNSIVLPAHGHCVCSTFPIYEKDYFQK